MEEKLTLEHLAPYLPYDLKLQNRAFPDYIIPLTGLDFKEESIISFSAGAFDDKPRKSTFANGGAIKPILRPLSDLTNEELSQFSVNFIMYYNHNTFDYKLMIVSDFELANKLHLDYRRLIEKGLAIDINTLKN